MSPHRAAALAAVLACLPAFAADPPAPTLDPRYREILGAPAGARLEGEPLAGKAKAVASVLRCPVCQGLSVEDSPSEMAQSMRAQVREMVAAGYDKEQVVSYFERSYGEFVRLEPKRQGVNWLVWLAPLGVLALGAVLVWAVLRRGGESAAVPAEPSEAQADELDPYLERVRAATRGTD